MFETIGAIVVAMIEHDYISKTTSDKENIKNINNAIKEIAKQLYDVENKNI
jgi:hypothetical protein